MLLPTKRIIVLTCIIFLVVLLAGYQILITHHGGLPPVIEALRNGSNTTEQLVPKFAYVQYATNIDYLCNAYINFNRLRRYGAKENLALIVPTAWASPESTSREALAVRKMQATLTNLTLHPHDVITTNKGDATWAESLTKFHAFNLTEYTRVLAFDSDSQVLNSMDPYVLAPLAAVALPRAYWLTEEEQAPDLGKQMLGSHVMLLEPNAHRYEKIIAEARKSGEFDMEVVNKLFRGSSMVLPHRRLALLSGEFRTRDHRRYLAPDEDEEWNAMGEISRSFLVHFSDWPLPKPWLPHSDAQWEAALPECRLPEDEERPDRPKCADRVMWTGIYEGYNYGRKKYCEGF